MGVYTCVCACVHVHVCVCASVCVHVLMGTLVGGKTSICKCAL